MHSPRRPFDAAFINYWCTRPPSALPPTSSSWEIINESSSVIPTNSFLFCSHLLGVKAAAVRGLCHVDATDWSRHLQLHRLYLSHLEPPRYCFPHGSVNVRRLMALYCLPQFVAAESSFVSHKRINMDIKFWKTGTNWVFLSPETIQQLFNCERWRAVIAVSIAGGFIEGGTFLWLNGGEYQENGN